MINTIIDILWASPITHILGIGTWTVGIAIGVYSRIG